MSKEKMHRVYLDLSETEYLRLKFHRNSPKQTVTNKVYSIVWDYLKGEKEDQHKFDLFLAQEGVITQSQSSPSTSDNMFK